MARKLILAADVVRALQELAARLLPHDDRSIRPAHRERRVALAVAELSYFNLGDVARAPTVSCRYWTSFVGSNAWPLRGFVSAALLPDLSKNRLATSAASGKRWQSAATTFIVLCYDDLWMAASTNR